MPHPRPEGHGVATSIDPTHSHTSHPIAAAAAVGFGHSLMDSMPGGSATHCAARDFHSKHWRPAKSWQLGEAPSQAAICGRSGSRHCFEGNAAKAWLEMEVALCAVFFNVTSPTGRLGLPLLY